MAYSVHELVTRHRNHVGETGQGTTVQISVELTSAVLFWDVEPAEINALTLTEFRLLCELTGQAPHALAREGALAIQDDAVITEFRDPLVDEY